MNTRRRLPQPVCRWSDLCVDETCPRVGATYVFNAESVQTSEQVVEFDSWNASADAYTFLYNPDLWQQGGATTAGCAHSSATTTVPLPNSHCPTLAVVKEPVLLKGVVLGDQLLFNWVRLHSSQQVPQQLELDISHYTTSKSGMHRWHQTSASQMQALCPGNTVMMLCRAPCMLPEPG